MCVVRVICTYSETERERERDRHTDPHVCYMYVHMGACMACILCAYGSTYSFGKVELLRDQWTSETDKALNQESTPAQATKMCSVFYMLSVNRVSQGLFSGLVIILISSWGHDRGVYMAATKSENHGPYLIWASERDPTCG